ncbi:hypothetical protein FHW12_001136 [Dokdonella fugitiva]|uniref:DUF1444 family protein n=1 Tax=Dokdonella fugitiva TaxID=328517 RepID=A0A839ET60_9GAMM|nr:hypothetical protein [Dokdonella fugitiva]MBA8886945.1 hypothetical protein [Dokdonella fugitiva]
MNILNLFDFKPKKRDFVSGLLRELARDGTHGWSHDAEANSLTHARGIVHLENLFREYAAAHRADRPHLLRKYAALAASLDGPAMPARWADAALGVRALVRSRYDRAFEFESSDRPATVEWPFVDDLHVRLAYDFGAYVTHVTRERAVEWAITDDAMRETAVANLEREPVEWQALGAGVFRLVADEHAESHLLVDATFERLPFRDAAAVPSNRGVLLACDRNDRTALRALLGEAERCVQQKPWPIAGTLLARDAGRWQPFLPDGELAVAARRLRTLDTGLLYADQKLALDRHHETIDHDVFVATCLVFEDDDELRSLCTWSEGVVTLLPRTDIVVFHRGTEPPQTLAVAWDDAISIAGAHLQASDFDPVRYLVDTFPTPEQWRALEACKPAMNARN